MRSIIGFLGGVNRKLKLLEGEKVYKNTLRKLIFTKKELILL